MQKPSNWSEEELILAVDVGTQSIRAMVFDAQGQERLRVRKLVPVYETKHPGWAELPADLLWSVFCSVTREVCEQLGEKRKNLRACSLTANRDNIIALDQNGKYLRNWMLWPDQRRCPEAVEEAEKNWKGFARLAYKLQKHLFRIALYRSKFNWIRFHEPEVWAQTAKYLTLGGLITYKLTGCYHDSYGMQVGVLPFEIKRMNYYKIPLIYKALGVRKDQLAWPLFHPSECMGQVTQEAEKQSGLPEGLPIVAAGGDKQTETLGAGAFDEKTAVLSYGTMATVTLTTERCIRKRDFLFYTFSATLRNHFCEEFVVDRGYWLVTWFCKQYAQEEGYPVFLDKMNRCASRIPPGSEGLFVYPFWAPHYVLFPQARGAMLGWSDEHTLAHLYRAILESLAYTLRYGLEALEKKSGIHTELLSVVGGGSQSDVAMQLTADIFNRPVQRLKCKEVGTIGAAIPAALYAGFFTHEKEAQQAFNEVEKVFYPQKEAVAIYEKIYKNVFLKFYNQAKDSFVCLNEIREQTRAQSYSFQVEEQLQNYEDFAKMTDVPEEIN